MIAVHGINMEETALFCYRLIFNKILLNCRIIIFFSILLSSLFANIHEVRLISPNILENNERFCTNNCISKSFFRSIVFGGLGIIIVAYAVSVS